MRYSPPLLTSMHCTFPVAYDISINGLYNLLCPQTGSIRALCGLDERYSMENILY